jgi:hypothetical protein
MNAPTEKHGDLTRPVQHSRPLKNAQQFVKQELGNLFDGYWRDLRDTLKDLWQTGQGDFRQVGSTPVQSDNEGGNE